MTRINESNFTGGHPPYGKTVIGAGRAAKLVDNHLELTAITLAREWAARGTGYNEIARRLTAQGFTSRTGSPLVATQVWRWLQRDF
jgi:hypothetical protein